MVRRGVDEWGRFDILVNNAGFLRDRMIFNMSEDGLRRRRARPRQGPLLHDAPRGRALAHRVERRRRPGLRPHDQHRVGGDAPREPGPAELRVGQGRDRQPHDGRREQPRPPRRQRERDRAPRPHPHDRRTRRVRERRKWSTASTRYGRRARGTARRVPRVARGREACRASCSWSTAARSRSCTAHSSSNPSRSTPSGLPTWSRPPSCPFYDDPHSRRSQGRSSSPIREVDPR